MNFQKLLIGSVVGTVFLFLLDYLLYGILLMGTFTMVAGCDRDFPDFMYLIPGLFVLVTCFTYIYLKGVDPRGTKVSQGIRYGIVIAMMIAFGLGLMHYSLQIPHPLKDYLIDAAVSIVRFSLLGILVAYVTGVPGRIPEGPR